MKILVAPLNWGLGHASRCVPLVRRFMQEGHEVILGGDGESLILLRKHFPKLRYTYLAPLNLRYSNGKRQVFAMVRAIPKLFTWALKDHWILKNLLKEEHIDLVVSDNRFGLYLTAKHTAAQKNGLFHDTETVYMTHQLHIMLPKGWRWLETLVARMHARIYTRFNKVWVPDYEDRQKCLAGDLSHLTHLPLRNMPCNIEYIGPLSRFEKMQSEQNIATNTSEKYEVVVVLSGLEPQRTLLEKEIAARFSDSKQRVLIVQGLMNRPNTRIKRANLTFVPHMSDSELVPALMAAKHIIARSGYSTIMDLHALGLLNSQFSILNSQLSISNSQLSILNSQFSILNSQLELIPTPGQPEQEYLAHFHALKTEK